MNKGKLFIVGTPIGNLKDITLRALEVLNSVDLILCEDTKTSIKLLNHYQIKKTLQSYYKPKEKQKLANIISWLKEGKNIALISDAGMPLISDPGELLVKTVREEGFEIECIPGPSSVLTALTLSGFSSARFVFEGFLPKQERLKIKILDEVKTLPHTLVFFVPARDLLKTLQSLRTSLGNRKVCIARELTKLYEEVLITEIDKVLAEKPIFKGEVTLIVEGALNVKDELNIEELRQYFKVQQKKRKTFKDVLKDDKLKHYQKNMLYDIWEEVKDGERKD